MRRRIRPTTEDLEPRVVLSVGSLTPRDATPPDDRNDSTDVVETDTTPATDNGRGEADPVVEPTDSGSSANSSIDTRSDAADTGSTDRIDEPLDSAPQSPTVRRVRLDGITLDRTPVVTVIPQVIVNVIDSFDDTTVTRADGVVPTEPTRTDTIDLDRKDVDVDLDVIDARGVTDDRDIEGEDASIAANEQDAAESADVQTDDAVAPATAERGVTAVTVQEAVDSELTFLEVAASEQADATDSDGLSNVAATDWLNGLQDSIRSWFGTTSDGDHAEVEPLAEQTASVAGVAGVLSLMAFGRKGLGDADRLPGALRGLLDLRDWRPTRSSNRRRQKSLPGHPAGRKQPVAAPVSLDEPELSDAFLMSVAVPVNPQSFSMSSIPADGTGSNDNDSNVTTTTAVVGVTAAAGGWAARRKSSSEKQKPARPQIEFGGTTFTRPKEYVG